MTTVNEDIEAIAGTPERLRLPVADVEILVEHLRTRQFFKLLRILTVGAGPLLAELQISEDTDPAELTQQLIMVLLVSIPEAEEEVMDFLKSMAKPVGLVEPERSKADREANVEKYTQLYVTLDNPDPQDTIELISRIIQIETPNLMALGKRLAAMLPSAAKQTTSSKRPSKKRTPSTS